MYIWDYATIRYIAYIGYSELGSTSNSCGSKAIGPSCSPTSETVLAFVTMYLQANWSTFSCRDCLRASQQKYIRSESGDLIMFSFRHSVFSVSDSSFQWSIFFTWATETGTALGWRRPLAMGSLVGPSYIVSVTLVGQCLQKLPFWFLKKPLIELLWDTVGNSKVSSWI